ncbi:sigma-54-dependent Fis family transcriptional regulator [Pseudomonas oryzihabitans]|uniref:sigma-54-dependent Fis family transcriptional regulator n=1 Tax=Pseudomonas oryzihabitans TaxID=47885 RepID=UPI00112239FB|nr:sigma-54-dependent Fis family transcriptional regulator [Pseudomonas psychrotolerans]QDD88483.1 sigma-54-dependent Fis family transcriptional regulator [Pseudomonas psychrotolerans]
MLSAQAHHHARAIDQALRAPLRSVSPPGRILESWRRSFEQHHLDPGCLHGPRILSRYELRQHQQAAEDFLRVADGELGALHARVEAADYCVLLADAQGHTLDYRVSDRLDDECRRAGLYLGTCWSEQEEGTCGVAAVLTDRAPVTVHKADHFRAAFTGLTCSAAPVFAPGGELLGVLDVSAPRSPDDRRSQLLIQQFTRDSAQRIENAYFMHSARGDWVLCGHTQASYLETQPEFLLAWDASGRLTGLNRPARHLCLSQLGYLPQRLEELFGRDATARLREDDDEPLRLGEARFHGRVRPPRPRVGAVIPLVRTSAEPEQELRVTRALETAVRLYRHGLPILVTGETGTGKEVFARALHGGGDRAARPFVALNCAALPESLIESELFGHAPGAFTGAQRQGRDGLIVAADGGTLFLDEIGDMPLALQTRLLRVLAEGEVLPVGSARPRRVDVRLVCATHRNLTERVAAGLFREDLLYRLNGAVFQLPPLRERADRLALARRLLAEECADRPAPDLAAQVQEAILAHHWPGNVRELRNVLRYAGALCEGTLITLDHLPASLHPEQPLASEPEPQVDSPERRAILAALVRHRWKAIPAARALGISRATLYRRLKLYGIAMPHRQPEA